MPIRTVEDKKDERKPLLLTKTKKPPLMVHLCRVFTISPTSISFPISHKKRSPANKSSQQTRDINRKSKRNKSLGSVALHGNSVSSDREKLLLDGTQTGSLLSIQAANIILYFASGRLFQRAEEGHIILRGHGPPPHGEGGNEGHNLILHKKLISLMVQILRITWQGARVVKRGFSACPNLFRLSGCLCFLN